MASEDSHPELQAKVQNHNRRRQYVQLLSNQLLEHLHRLQRRWQPSNGYYAELLNRTPAQQTLLASLMASQALLSKELLDRRLGTNSSEFSNTGIDDVIAINVGLKTLLAGAEEQQGVITLLPQPLEQQWQTQFKQLDQLLVNWQEQGPGNADLNQKVRLEFIGLLSLLEKTAEALDLRLPRTEDLARR